MIFAQVSVVERVVTGGSLKECRRGVLRALEQDGADSGCAPPELLPSDQPPIPGIS